MLSFLVAMKELLRLPRGWAGRAFLCQGLQGTRHSHRHDELEFNLVTRGHASYVLAARRYELPPSSLVWLFPAQEHVLTDWSPDFAMWVVVFRASMVRRLCRQGTARQLGTGDPPGEFCRWLGRDDALRLGRLLTDLAAGPHGAPETNAGLAYLLLASWAAFERGRPVPVTTVLHPAVRRTVLELQRPVPGAGGLKALARRAGLSPARLSRVFGSQMGMPLSQFRNRLRLERFLQLQAAHPAHNLLPLALEAGFGSYAQFHRVFRQFVGCSPGTWERRMAAGAG
jgi:AraC-like DNA-binding protein